MPEIIVVGSANADVVVAAERRPGPGETVLGGDTEVGPGGKGGNTAVAAARLGGDVALLGAVGVDANGEMLIEALLEAGVETRLVQRIHGPSGAAYITVTPDGENSILVSPGANRTVTTATVDAAADEIAAARVLFSVLEVPLPTAEHAVAVAAAAGVRPVVNASPVARLPAATLAALDPLIVNQHEAASLLGANGEQASGAEWARRLLHLGPRSVVVTLGADGVAIADRVRVTEVPAPQVTVVDTTGAGDAFAGGLLVGLARGEDLVTAARRAVRVAAVSVTRRGAQDSYPFADEVATR